MLPTQFWYRDISAYMGVTFWAWGPFSPCTTSNSTRWSSRKDLNPSILMEVWCTNTSGPSSCWIKPKPLASLNHFTVPFTRSVIVETSFHTITSFVRFQPVQNAPTTFSTYTGWSDKLYHYLGQMKSDLSPIFFSRMAVKKHRCSWISHCRTEAGRSNHQ